MNKQTQPDTSTLAGKIAVMQAALEGKRIQSRYINISNQYGETTVWQNTIAALCWSWNECNYRIHPDDLNPPRLRVWNCDEIPVGALIRAKGCQNLVYAIVARCDNKVRICEDIGVRQYDTEHVLRCYEHSLDGGKTWQHCGVME